MAGMFKNIIHKVRENIRYRSYLNPKNIYMDTKINIFKEFNFSVATSKNDLNYEKIPTNQQSPKEAIYGRNQSVS